MKRNFLPFFVFVSASACAFEHGVALDPTVLDSGSSATDAQLRDGDTAVDAAAAPQDASLPPPLDAFACTNHGQCSSMVSGTCCVDPGSMGHCETGTIIATVCVTSNP
jgi:hypothetical protein